MIASTHPGEVDGSRAATDLDEVILSIQSGVIEVQEGAIDIVQAQGADLESPLQSASTSIQRGASTILKAAIAVQEAARTIKSSSAYGLRYGVKDPSELTAVALTLAQNNRFADAIRLYQESIAIEPNNAETHKHLGDACLNSGLLDQAVASYEQAVSIRPEYSEADNNLAIALLNHGNYRRAGEILRRSLIRNRGLPSEVAIRFDPSYASKITEDTISTSPFKILDRIEQLQYLLENKFIDPSFVELVSRLQAAYYDLERDEHRKPYSLLNERYLQSFGGYFDRMLYYGDAPRISGPTMNDSLDYKALEDKYIETRCLFFDDFLSPIALANLRRFFLQSTVFFRFSEAGFVASYVTDGFCCGLVFQLIEELHERFPRILKDKHLNNMWCYRYCSAGHGVRPHNGDGSVTINFYLTPDSANLDSAGGGMVMYDKEHPREWDWLKYNMNKDDPDIQADISRYLADAKAETVPYRCNRAVLFHSTLFHKTDPYHFREGFENRRMNITMLFGKRAQESASMR